MSDNEFDKAFLFSMNHNLNWNVRFHNEIRRLMHNEVVTINLELDDCSEEKRYDLKFRRTSIVNSFYYYALNNSFLMQWSLIEEMLYLIHKFNYSDLEIPKKTSFQKYRAIFERSVGDLLSYSPWQFLVSAEKIRNCLLHANGRTDLSKDSEWLNSEVKRNPKLYTAKNAKLTVTGEFINILTENARRILKDLRANKSLQPTADASAE